MKKLFYLAMAIVVIWGTFHAIRTTATATEGLERDHRNVLEINCVNMQMLPIRIDRCENEEVVMYISGKSGATGVWK